MKTVIVANYVLEGQRIAEKRGLRRGKFYIVTASSHHALRGLGDTEFLIADCWQEHPSRRSEKFKLGSREISRTVLQYPLTDELRMLQATTRSTFEWVRCA